MPPQTSPDALPYPVLDDPANVPQDMQELAQATQAALNNHLDISAGQLGFSAVEYGPSTGALVWNDYTTITVLESVGWQGIGAWCEFATIPRAGTLEIVSQHYLECTGGTAAAQTVWAATQVLWHDGAGPGGQERPTIARLTAPKGAGPITVGGQSILRFPNNAAKAIRVRPCGQVAAVVAGGQARIGIHRVSLRFIPAPYAVGTVGYTAG
jgi:hypothetical protein